MNFGRLLTILLASVPLLAQDGGTLLNSGWRLRPAGTETPLSTLPMSAAVSPDGKYVLVLNGGIEPPTISELDAATGVRPISRPLAASSTLIDGGARPPFSTSTYLPSGETAADIGKVESGVSRPAGRKRQPLLRRVPPSCAISGTDARRIVRRRPEFIPRTFERSGSGGRCRRPWW
jgi:hypothetical protein